MPNNKAIVTLTLGKTYQSFWERMCCANWEEYARRNDYDVIALSEPLDPTLHAAERQLSWQKCLILSQPFSAQYERIVWLDADILINPDAPDISAEVYLLIRWGQPTNFLRPREQNIKSRWQSFTVFGRALAPTIIPARRQKNFMARTGCPEHLSGLCSPGC